MGDASKPRWTPAVSSRTQLLTAAVVWSVVGTGLLGVGLHWTLNSDLGWHVLGLAGAIGAGLLKSYLVLDNSALNAIARIRRRGDGLCLGGFQSPGSWVLVLGMMFGGRALRYWVLSPGMAGLVYIAIGVALIRSSRLQWRGVFAAGHKGERDG